MPLWVSYFFSISGIQFYYNLKAKINSESYTKLFYFHRYITALHIYATQRSVIMQNFQKICDMDLLIPGFCCLRPEIEVKNTSFGNCVYLWFHATMYFDYCVFWYPRHIRTTLCAILTTLHALNSHCKSSFNTILLKIWSFSLFFVLLVTYRS